MKSLFYKFFSSIARIFSGYKILWHLLAIVLTYFIVISNLDWIYFETTRKPRLLIFFFPAVILGGLLPILVPLFMLIIGWIKKNFRIKNTALALGQAAILGEIISSAYKAITGRAHPLESFMDGAVNISHIFKFGFFRGGIFWGWPSSHTTIAFAMAVTLIFLYPKNKIVKCLAVAYALYIGIGVSMTIHWFSDFIAGMIFGTIIGIVVGKSFLGRLK